MCKTLLHIFFPAFNTSIHLGHGTRFVLPVPGEQLEACRAEMRGRGTSLDEGFVATIKACAAARSYIYRVYEKLFDTHG